MTHPLLPALIPLSLGMFQALQHVVEPSPVCEQCATATCPAPCQLKQDARWDTVFTSVLVGVMVYCLSRMKLGGLAWGLVTPAVFFFLCLLAGTVSAESYVPLPVKMHPALLEEGDRHTSPPTIYLPQ